MRRQRLLLQWKFTARVINYISGTKHNSLIKAQIGLKSQVIFRAGFILRKVN